VPALMASYTLLPYEGRSGTKREVLLPTQGVTVEWLSLGGPGGVLP